jgi:hypothetical protein
MEGGVNDTADAVALARGAYEQAQAQALGLLARAHRAQLRGEPTPGLAAEQAAAWEEVEAAYLALQKAGGGAA